MWHNVLLLRGFANVLFFVATVSLVWAMGHYVVTQPDLLPIKTVRLQDAPQRIDVRQLEALVKQQVQGNFFTVDIDQLRESLVGVPWVRSVKIRREFPDALSVTFEEHQPLAYWNNSALVNVQGEVFMADSNLVLPHFIGQEGSSAKVTEYYRKFGQQLSSLGVKLNQVALSPRHAWQLYLDNGIVLELGRESVEQRLARFVKVYPYMSSRLALVEQQRVRVDMRYRNGFAIRREMLGTKG